jgi:ligand-binding sensor protein
VPLVAVSNSCAFCSLILSTERGRDGCSAAWRRPDNGRLHSCHAGLLCASAPVEVDDQRVALCAACQFTTQTAEGGRAWQAAIPRLAAELDLAEEALWAAAGSVRLLAAEQARRAPVVVHRVASTFAQIGQERQSLLRRLHHIAEISKI